MLYMVLMGLFGFSGVPFVLLFENLDCGRANAEASIGRFVFLSILLGIFWVCGLITLACFLLPVIGSNAIWLSIVLYLASIIVGYCRS